MRFLEGIDLGALFFFQHHHLPWLDFCMVQITRLGNNPFLLVVASLLVMIFLFRRNWRTALMLGLVWSLCWGLTEGTKYLVQRPRPPEGIHGLIEMPSNPSFPSGHAMNGMAIYLGSALLIARRLRRGGTIVIVLGAIMGLALGTSRLYCGVHYLTDVLGGWCAGVAFALLITWADRRINSLTSKIPEPRSIPATGAA